MCDPFITQSLLYNMSDYDHCVRVARVFTAVTKAANSLIQYYSSGSVLLMREE